MAYSPTQLKAALELMDQEWDDVTDLAKAVLKQHEQLEDARPKWVAIAAYKGRPYLTLGPFRSPTAARKALSEMPGIGPDCRAGVFPLGVTDEDDEEPSAE